jgi:hypothetical protein
MQLSVESGAEALTKKRLSSKQQGSAHSSERDTKEQLVSEKLNSFREQTQQP